MAVDFVFIRLFVVCVCAFKVFFVFVFPLFVYFMCSFHFIAGGVRFNLLLAGN